MRRRNKDRLTPAEEKVLRIQQGDTEAFYELKEQYSRYLENYERIVKGALRLRDLRRKSVRRFAKRFIDPSQTKAINVVIFGWMLPYQPIVSEVLQWLKESIWLADLEDMLSEIDLCFYECCMSYDPQKSDWDLFLFVRFQKRFVDHMKKWFSPYSFTDLEPMTVHYDEDLSVELYQPAAEIDGYLGSGWVWGIDCSYTFAALSPFERWLIAERFGEKRKIADIAKQTGLRYGEVIKRIKQAVARLEESGRFWHTLSRPSLEEKAHETSGPAD